MAKFIVEWTEESFFRAEVEAESEEQARDKFWSGDYDGDAKLTGIEIQDSVEIEEAE